MTKDVGRHLNVTTDAQLLDGIELNASTSTEIVVENLSRIFLEISNPDPVSGVWIKLQSAGVDDDKKGIYLPKQSAWRMPNDNIYTGAISAIANSDSPTVYVTEY